MQISIPNRRGAQRKRRSKTGRSSRHVTSARIVMAMPLTESALLTESQNVYMQRQRSDYVPTDLPLAVERVTCLLVLHGWDMASVRTLFEQRLNGARVPNHMLETRQILMAVLAAAETLLAVQAQGEVLATHEKAPTGDVA